MSSFDTNTAASSTHPRLPNGRQPLRPPQYAEDRALWDFSLRGSLDRWDLLVWFGLAALVGWTRHIFAGPVYFVDGPLLVAAIRIRWYLIQSPGYWLFAHMGGLFHDPATGLAFWVQLFSALGGATFYVLCRMCGTHRKLATLAALTYSFSLHIWFAGEIHSTYAAEILFPVLTLCCFLKLQEQRSPLWAALAALSSGLAIALRPSDGIFLLPLWCYLLLHGRYRWKVLITFCLVSLTAFLAWYLPTQRAVRRIGFNSTESQLMTCLHATSVFLVGFSPHALANISRVYVPLLAIYWPVLPLFFLRRGRAANWTLALWVLPGLAFFTFGYMADPTYVVYLSGAFVLAAVMQARRRVAVLSLIVCLLCNASLFLFARPVQSGSFAGLAWNYYLTKYSAYGIQHRWSATPGQRVPLSRVQTR